MNEYSYYGNPSGVASMMPELVGGGKGRMIISATRGISKLLAGGMTGGITDLANTFLQYKQFKYQKELNKLQRSREDSGLQRMRKDADLAGISPYASMAGAHSSGGTSATAPQLKAQNLMNALNIAMMKQNISKSQTDQQFINAQTEEKLWNLGKAKEWELPTGAKGDWVQLLQMLGGTFKKKTGKSMIDSLLEGIK